MASHLVYEELINLLNDDTRALDLNDCENFSPILDQIGQARLVLMGEATHGTEEFYQTRIALSKLLIEKKGFQAIAIEGDWPSAHQVHRYIQGHAQDSDAVKILQAFKRFPTWMWANTALPSFLRWLKNYNDKKLNPLHKVGFYGLDLYSLHESMQAVIDYLQKYEPSAASKAIERFKCFDHTVVDPQIYGYLVSQRIKKACVKEVTEQLLEIQHQIFSELNNQMLPEDEESYYATQNARLVKNAEEYYRSMFEPRAISWNIRDQHMAQTLNNLIVHMETLTKAPAKIIVWAHNSHVGDARATEMHEQGEINLGQIVREQYDTASYLLGFSTYSGTVRAASDWDAESKIMNINPGVKGSYEDLFHQANKKIFWLNLRSQSHLNHLLEQSKLQRAIGVVYLPESERMSHYYFAKLPYQFDSLIHVDQTHAVIPLSEEGGAELEEPPETFPSGI